MTHAVVSQRPGREWAIVTRRELLDLWFTWRAPALVIAASLLLSVITYLSASNTELNLLDQKDTVALVVQVSLALGVAIGLLVAADTISGERERRTLESLLLTPVTPRQLILGKLVAALSIWPLATVVAWPYVWILRAGDQVAFDAITSGALVGLLLSLAFASFGILLSSFTSSNRASLALTFFIFVAMAVATQLPGGATAGWFGRPLVHINPLTAGFDFVKRVAISNHPWS